MDISSEIENTEKWPIPDQSQLALVCHRKPFFTGHLKAPGFRNIRFWKNQQVELSLTLNFRNLFIHLILII